MSAAPLRVTRAQAIAFRLRANDLHRRLPARSLAHAARFALQDTIPRAALLSLHARVRDVGPADWEHPSLLQLWSPRTAVHVIAAADHAVYTLGRHPRDPAARHAIASAGEAVRRALGGHTRRHNDVHAMPGGPPAMRLLFRAAIDGTIAIRWDTRDTVVREVARPAGDPEECRLELCRRHVRAFAPTTPAVFAWWAGVGRDDAAQTWRALARELMPTEIEGHRAWALREDEAALRTPAPVEGVRFLPAEDLKLFGQDAAGLFAGPKARGHQPGFDWNHPSALLVDGEIVGSWGRRGGRVEVVPWRHLDGRTRRAIEAEGLSFPIDDPKRAVRFVAEPTSPPETAGE